MSKPQKTLAVFPGMFDPPTLGHVDIVHRACNLFDELVVAVGVNPEKKAWFSLEERLSMIKEALVEYDNVRVESYNVLTMDYVQKIGAKALVRGIRDTTDLREEIRIANLNQMMGDVETVFLLARDQHIMTASSLIKQIVEMGAFSEARMARLVPPTVVQRLAKRVNESSA